MSDTYLIPQDTKEAGEYLVSTGQAIKSCINASLLLHKYAPREIIESPEKNTEWLKNFCGKFELKPANEYGKLVAAQKKRWDMRRNDETKYFTLVTRSRLLVGSGDKNAMEIGLTLQHVTGLPYIPGSALKGLARATALIKLAQRFAITMEKKPIEIFEELLVCPTDATQERAQLWEKLKMNDTATQKLSLATISEDPEATLFQTVFGSQQQAGACVFYDAALIDLPYVKTAPGTQSAQRARTLFEVDVLTPHFPNYYRYPQNKPPSDDQSPIPVMFLTVAAGVRFGFTVAPAGIGRAKKSTVEQAEQWLKEGLTRYGIGGKTSAGYGAFTETEVLH